MIVTLVQTLETPVLGTVTLSMKIKRLDDSVWVAFFAGDNHEIIGDGEVSITATGTTEKVYVFCVSEAGGSLEIEWIRLEPGFTASPFVSSNRATELLTCMRYYQKWGGANIHENSGQNTLTIRGYYPVPMRIAPTIRLLAKTIYGYKAGVGPVTFTPTEIVPVCTEKCANFINITGSFSQTVPDGSISIDTDSILELSADL